MQINDVVNLISTTVTADEYLVEKTSETLKEVYCTVQSISSKEFLESKSTDLIPAYKFTVFAGDYNGENLVEYNDERYVVYRTFFKNVDRIELYVAKRSGI